MLALAALVALLQAALTAPKPVPRLQAVPLAYNEVSFQLDGTELARYHSEPGIERPFVFPVVGPSGRLLTRMGHPQDPVTHSHHSRFGWVTAT